MIDDPAGAIEYHERGAGPTVVFVPGSCSTGAAWRPVIERIEHCFRCVATSLPGYGRTAERRTPIDPPMVREVEALEAVVRRAARGAQAPVHLVGHSFGGLVALALTLRRAVPVASLTLAEAPAATLLHACGEVEHFRAFRQMTDRYYADFHDGVPDAIRSMIDFYGGQGTFAAWPERVRSYACATTSVNILDWTSCYGFPLTPRALGSLSLPVRVICGGLSNPAMLRASHLLASHAPLSSFAIINGAAHFLISTHPAEFAALVKHMLMPGERAHRVDTRQNL